MKELSERVEAFVRRHSLMQKGDRLVIAVSGGADSMVLLHLLCGMAGRWDLHLSIAHLDHGLRGEESEQDAEFVRQQAESLGLPFYLQRCDVRELARQKNGNLEDCGREARKLFLASVAGRLGADRVALGHHRNDQAETVLHHLLRGTGLRGLGGMQPCSMNLWIRPLLAATREEILEYAGDRRLEYRQDHSNDDLNFTRNRIRHELIPILQRTYNRQAVRALDQVSRLARSDEDFLYQAAAQIDARITRRKEGGYSWPVVDLLALHEALRRRILLQAMESLSEQGDTIGFAHVEQVVSLLEEGKSGKRISLPGGLAAQRQFAELFLTRETGPWESSWELPLSVPGRTEGPDGLWWLETKIVKESGGIQVPVRSRSQTALPIAENGYYLRDWRPGDVYCRRHRRTLKRLWNDAKVPLGIRHQLPLIVEGDLIRWIPGFPPANLSSSDNSSPGAIPTGPSLYLILHPQPDTLLAEWLAGRDRACG